MFTRLTAASTITGMALCSTLAAANLAPDERTWCGTGTASARDAVWAHREQQARQGRIIALTTTAATDVGEIAVLQDEGDLAALRNRVDLQDAGLEFARRASGYRVTRVDRPVGGGAATPLPLEDDDSEEVELPFAFTFFGRQYESVFVNSDGNLTFGEADNASTARSLGRVVEGPPRIAPLFADFDPTSGGSVGMTNQGDRLTVTWSAVPQYGETDANTFEVTLRSDGGVEFAYGTELNAMISEGVVGIAPGAGQGGITALDFSATGGIDGTGALVESYRSEDSLNTVAVARKFYQSHGDDYMQLVVFTSRRLTSPNTFAYEVTVKTSETGIGGRAMDESAEFGSAGRLESFVMMDDVDKYPEDLAAPFLGADSPLAILAHETGHRWLAQAIFRDGASDSRELLGRDEVHWSFFLDSDASHLEGNDIEDVGGGQFRSVAAGQRYSPLDQYLIGLRGPEEVPPFFFVRGPLGVGDTDPGRPPQPGLIFQGTRIDVTIENLIAAMGPRQPPAGVAPTSFRQAFIYVAVGQAPSAAEIERIERFRAAWEPHFARATEGRAAVQTNLN